MPSMDLLLAPLFGAIALGVITGYFRLFSEEDARVFSRFVFMVAMPVAVFNFMRQTDPPGPAYAGLIAAYVLSVTACASFAFWLSRRFGKLTVRETGAAVFATLCGNAVFLGLPIALNIPGWGPPFLIMMIFEGFLAFAIGGVLITWPDRQGETVKIRHAVMDALVRVVRNPIIIALMLGLVLAITPLDLPSWLAGVAEMFGRIASPFGLFVLGLYLAILPRTTDRFPIEMLSTLLPIKLLLFPAMTGGLTWVFTRDPLLTTVAGFFTLLPPAVTSVVLAATYHQLERRTAAMVVTGTLIGLVTMTGFLFWAAG